MRTFPNKGATISQNTSHQRFLGKLRITHRGEAEFSKTGENSQL